MYQGHFLGYVVRHLREMRLKGANSYQLMAYLRRYFPDGRTLAVRYLNYAFMGKGLRLVGVLRMGKWEDYPADSEVWQMAEGIIDGAKPYWSQAPIPELMRVRDYLALLEFSRDQQVTATVCAASPAAGQWIGRAGTRCYAGRMFVPSRAAGPEAGLLAADPNDPHVQSALAAYGGIAYADYVERLAADGYRVLSAQAGFLLVDRDEHRLHESYRLHGVYDTKTSEAVWTAKRGEHLRAAINQCLGQELVRVGPHDQWEHRNDKLIAGPWCGPQLPAIEFSQGEKMRSILSVQDLVEVMPYDANWSDLYPHHPLDKDS